MAKVESELWRGVRTAVRLPGGAAVPLAELMLGHWVSPSFRTGMDAFNYLVLAQGSAADSGPWLVPCRPHSWQGQVRCWMRKNGRVGGVLPIERITLTAGASRSDRRPAETPRSVRSALD